MPAIISTALQKHMRYVVETRLAHDFEWHSRCQLDDYIADLDVCVLCTDQYTLITRLTNYGSDFSKLALAFGSN